MKKKKILKMLDEIFSDLMHIDHPAVVTPPNAIQYKTCCCNLCTALCGLSILKASLRSELLDKDQKRRSIREQPKIEVVLYGALSDLLDQLQGIGIPDWKGAEGLYLDIAKKAIEEYNKQRGK